MISTNLRGIVPLSTKFNYVSLPGFVPIHEVAEDHNLRIKDFYWRLWFDDDDALKTTKNERVQVPMDFGMVTGWQACPCYSGHEFHTLTRLSRLL